LALKRIYDHWSILQINHPISFRKTPSKQKDSQLKKQLVELGHFGLNYMFDTNVLKRITGRISCTAITRFYS